MYGDFLMKKMILVGTTMLMLASFASANNTTVKNTAKPVQELNYSMETQKKIQRIMEENGQQDFCKNYLSRIKAQDLIGQSVIKSICVADYINYNIITSWGDELYDEAMSKSKKPGLYKSALPIAPMYKERFMAMNAILATMFWTSTDRYNVKVQATPAQEPVTQEQYAFFNDLYNKIKDSDGANLKPVAIGFFDTKSYPLAELKKSPTFVNYAKSLIETKKMYENAEKNMDIVMSSFANYKEYLNFVYSKKMDEVIEKPESFKNYKFTKVQCAGFALSISESEYKAIQEKAKFTCN